MRQWRTVHRCLDVLPTARIRTGSHAGKRRRHGSSPRAGRRARIRRHGNTPVRSSLAAPRGSHGAAGIPSGRGRNGGRIRGTRCCAYRMSRTPRSTTLGLPSSGIRSSPSGSTWVSWKSSIAVISDCAYTSVVRERRWHAAREPVPRSPSAGCGDYWIQRSEWNCRAGRRASRGRGKDSTCG